MRPTGEQQAVIDAITSGKVNALIVTAGAGSGKTSTLHAAAQAVREVFGRDKKIVVTAFNKDVIRDADARFGNLATCKTTHSLAYATHGRLYRGRMDANPTDSARGLAAKLGFKGTVALMDAKGEFTLKTVDAARLVRKTVDRFCSSADFDIAAHHIPHTLDRDHTLYGEFVALILDAATDMWDELQDPAGRKFRFTHDMYRKLWALSQPKINADILMLDEAQDTPPVMEKVFRDQVHAVRVAVGDSNQGLYEFTGAVDALAKLRDNDPDAVECELRQSFRFGRPIADLANMWLALPVMRTTMQIIGNPERESRIAVLDKADAILCRTNAGAFGVVVENVLAGRRTALVGNIKAMLSLIYGLQALSQGRPVRHSDLAVFESWADLEQAIKDEDVDSDLTIAFQIYSKYGTETIKILGRLVAEADAEVVVSTAHKSKGREWDSVKIHEDFAPKLDKQGNPVPVTRAWGNLAYVAVTRAKLVLDPGPLATTGS